MVCSARFDTAETLETGAEFQQSLQDFLKHFSRL